MSLVYLLDTNVVSELARRQPDAEVERRVIATQPACAIAAATVEELAFGVARMATSAKREMLEVWLAEILGQFAVMPYDDKAALWLGRERARLAAAGQPAPRTDGEIASIAATNGLILVTRNLADFRGFRGVQVENWFGG